MGKTSTKAKSAKTDLNLCLQTEINRLAEIHNLNTSVFTDFAYFVIENHKKKDSDVKPVKPKPLTLTQIKASIYQHFSVKTTTELKTSGAFKMATDGMDKLNLSIKEEWEKLYRKFIGILPGEENQKGYGCINGINIFNYFKPWQVFKLDPQTATIQDIKNAYYKLSQIYHPDIPQTGDAAIFDCLTMMYKSITAEA